jgi:hypothetical protein
MPPTLGLPSTYEVSHIRVFGYPKTYVAGRLNPMTSPAQLGSLVAAKPADVLVAGVPWPRHKLFAVLAGLVTLLLVGAVTASGAAAFLSGAAVAITVGLTLRVLAQPHD